MVNKKQNEDLIGKDADYSKNSDQYLTQMKELPPVFEEDNKSEKKERSGSEKTPDLIKTEKTSSDKQKMDSSEEVSDKAIFGESGNLDSEGEEKNKKSIPISSKDIILGVINIISVIFLILILTKFPNKAQELKKLHIESMTNESNVSVEFPEISDGLLKVEKLEPLFLDEGGIVNFVDDLEKIKVKNEAIKSVTFTSQKVIKDKTGNFGYPVMIEMSGNWDMFDLALQEIDKLPYLFRTAKVTIEKDEKENVILFNYGVFLYVNPKLGENR
ncbi:hypothetical protein A2159_00975 [Candidatus Woesebacteria bacterium RBG_13_34_9]|uniref:Uncharacterized protein n=1 Tax=Candidatus Woesebacteria bacterium RBG_13_34_9 TaxID=1802477 RepID=A0A1F7X331_9BACT|nr:MAG: hypothetical protein A2159_00975 [Candidatus Woesebacteria bacterium RBG_13_34_9]